MIQKAWVAIPVLLPLSPQFPQVWLGWWTRWFSFFCELFGFHNFFQALHFEKNVVAFSAPGDLPWKERIRAAYTLSPYELLTTYVCVFQLTPHAAAVKALGELDILLQWMEEMESEEVRNNDAAQGIPGQGSQTSVPAEAWPRITTSLFYSLVLVTVYTIYLLFVSLLWLFLCIPTLNLDQGFIRFW